MPAWCYILSLQDECFYVGASEQVTYRIEQHFQENGGSKWCFMHKPKEMVYLEKFNTMREALACERRKVIEFMRIHGIRKVRGHDAVNCRPDCYRAGNLWWLPAEIRKDASLGKLGKLD